MGYERCGELEKNLIFANGGKLPAFPPGHRKMLSKELKDKIKKVEMMGKNEKEEIG